VILEKLLAISLLYFDENRSMIRILSIHRGFIESIYYKIYIYKMYFSDKMLLK